MKNLLAAFLIMIISNNITAQITVIPDANFEEWLIDHNIDSDGIINGQILTSDTEGVTELNIEGWDEWSDIADLTGIQDFTDLERLSISYTEITALDVTHNLQLRELRCGSNLIADIDLSSNPLLEIIDISTGGDVGPWNVIQKLDLSSNPNIHTIIAADCSDLEVIDLRNGANNPNMLINIGIFPGPGPDIDPAAIYNNVCIEIDDVDLAQNGQLPYSEWEIVHYHVSYQLLEDCILGVKESRSLSLRLYPNPANDIVTIANTTSIEEITIYDYMGRMVLQQKCSGDTVPVNISSLQAGSYIIKVTTASGTATRKLVAI